MWSLESARKGALGMFMNNSNKLSDSRGFLGDQFWLMKYCGSLRMFFASRVHRLF